MPIALYHGAADVTGAEINPVTVMGMPFPTGLVVLGDDAPGWVPWAWAINAFMTVLGPLVCVVLSMEVGFTVAFGVSAAGVPRPTRLPPVLHCPAETLACRHDKRCGTDSGSTRSCS